MKQRKTKIKWLPPIPPPSDPKLLDIWRMYEDGRIIVTRLCGQIGNK